MREIKFRAKARFSGTIGSDKWIYSSVMRLDAPTNRLNLGGLDCDLETLGQFTGLYDKNGKEIYEGDIVKSDYTGEKDVIKFGQYIEKTDEDDIKGNGFFWGEDPNELGFSLDYEGGTKRYEVIGNIHENKE